MREWAGPGLLRHPWASCLPQRVAVAAIMGGGHYGWRLPDTTSRETGPLSLHRYYIPGLSLYIYMYIILTYYTSVV